MSGNFDISQINWSKVDNLVPAIVQDANTKQVLMLGYMNLEALEKTIKLKQLTFYSRSKQRLWTKGESSGHYLDLVDIKLDCDQDSLLILAKPKGPCCHNLTTSCFGEADKTYADLSFLLELEYKLQERFKQRPAGSYVTKLFDEGVKRIAQKVGEEGVEVSLAAMGGDKAEIISESADLIFHLLVLLISMQIDLNNIINELKKRNSGQ